MLKDTKRACLHCTKRFIGKNGIDTKAGRAQYQVTGDNFKLAEGQNELSVPLTFEKDGVTYRKNLCVKT